MPWEICRKREDLPSARWSSQGGNSARVRKNFSGFTAGGLAGNGDQAVTAASNPACLMHSVRSEGVAIPSAHSAPRSRVGGCGSHCERPRDRASVPQRPQNRSAAVQPMTSNNIRQQVFRRMLAREAGTGANAPAIAAAARRLCERFAEQLTPLIGVAGVAAICARSLHLTQLTVPGLAPVRASAQGDAPFALLQLSLEQQEPTVATDAAVALLATISELLALFVGESLTTSLLREAWPDDFAVDTTEETIT